MTLTQPSLTIDTARLRQILAQDFNIHLANDLEKKLHISLDSRCLVAPALFIALPGLAQDGRQYIESALANGAAIVLAQAPCTVNHPRVYILEHLKTRLGALLAAVLPELLPLTIIAVTGTNGKSSTTHYLAQLSNQLGKSMAVLGTLGAGGLGHLFPSSLTTADLVTNFAWAQFTIQHHWPRLALEASSHALDQRRLDGLQIKAAVFTNLTHDHLDYHRTLANYAAAKALLFARPELQLAVINVADPHALVMCQTLHASVHCITINHAAKVANGDFQVLAWQPEPRGQIAQILTPEGNKTLQLALLGRFNLDNVLLAIATLYGLGDDLDLLLAAARTLTAVCGRMEPILGVDDLHVYVDYAHTPDALQNALLALRQHAPGRLGVIFGCGGNRDVTKRPIMGQIAAKYADYVIITDDNPRQEDPAKIRAMIKAPLFDNARVSEIADRKQAIEQTILQARPHDTLLIAGKGHEDYQIVGSERHYFSDQLVAQQALAKRAARGTKYD